MQSSELPVTDGSTDEAVREGAPGGSITPPVPPAVALINGSAAAAIAALRKARRNVRLEGDLLQELREAGRR